MAAHAASTVLAFGALDEARDFAKDAGLKQQFLDAIGPASTVETIASLAEVILAVSTLIWTFRICSNLVMRGKILRFSPWLSTFSWVLPPLLFVFPFLVLRDLAYKTDQFNDQSGNRLRTLITQWFVAYGVIPLVLAPLGVAISGGISQSEQDLAKALSDQLLPNTLSAITLIAAAFLWRQIVSQLSSRLS